MKALIAFLMSIISLFGIGLNQTKTLVFTIESEEGSDEAIEKTYELFEYRLNASDFEDAKLKRMNNNTIELTVPYDAYEDEYVKYFLSDSSVTFEDYEGNVIIDGSHIVSANAIYTPAGESHMSEWYIQIVLTTEGTAIISNASKEIINYTDGCNYMSILVNGEIISSPVLSAPLEDSEITISGSFDEDSAKDLAYMIGLDDYPAKLTYSGIK